MVGAGAGGQPGFSPGDMWAGPVVVEAGGTLADANVMIERPRRRRRVFDSAEAMFANFENKPPFHTWRRDILWEYCRAGAAAHSEGKWELKCPPEIEALLYATARDFGGLERVLQCKIPLTALFGTRGEESTGARFSGRLPRNV